MLWFDLVSEKLGIIDFQYDAPAYGMSISEMEGGLVVLARHEKVSMSIWKL